MKKEIVEALKFIDNYQKSRFELSFGNNKAYVYYIISKGRVILIDTSIPTNMHSIVGLGEVFIRNIIKFANKNSLELYSKCPYANALLQSGVNGI